MMIGNIGPLTRADESLRHQIADSFGTVGESDRTWTEKVWGSLARKDGTLQVDFGLGRYHNRGVIDGFGGVSRGREQWTVRASRELALDPDNSLVGPVRYEVLEPLERVRFALDANDALDLSFDLVFTAQLRPFFEERNSWRDISGRVQSNVVRYHQGGTVSGWLRLDGTRLEIDSDEWFGFRDHSWGVRGEGAVGNAPTDVAPTRRTSLSSSSEIPTFMHWTPWLMHRADGSRYEVHMLVTEAAGYRMIDSAYINHEDGTQERIRRVHTDVSYDTETRYLLGGRIGLERTTGEIVEVNVEPVGESGFFLRTGGYGGWRGHRHGVWLGALVVDGEHIADCWEPETRRSLGQFRDRPVKLMTADAEGYGIFETIVTGVWPALGLTAESNYGGY